MKKVLSIDIGLKNLSFCCMSKDADSDLLKIHLWENYNLLEPEVVKCKALTKKQIVCGKICKYNSNEAFFCKTHLPKGEEAFKEIKKKLVNSFTLQQISVIVLNKIIEIVKDNEEALANLDLVQIEKQVRVNPKMIMVADLVFGKFCELLDDQKTKVRFVNASKKGALFKTTEDSEITGTMKGAKGYSNRKKASIEYGTNFLKSGKVLDSEYWLEKMQGESKTDDLMDCILFNIAELIGVDPIVKKSKFVKRKNVKKR